MVVSHTAPNRWFFSKFSHLAQGHSKPGSPFNLIFTTVLLLTLGSGDAAFHLASRPTLTEAQGRILDSAMNNWTMGTATLIGLLSIGGNNKDDDGAPE